MEFLQNNNHFTVEYEIDNNIISERNIRTFQIISPQSFKDSKNKRQIGVYEHFLFRLAAYGTKDYIIPYKLGFRSSSMDIDSDEYIHTIKNLLAYYRNQGKLRMERRYVSRGATGIGPLELLKILFAFWLNTNETMNMLPSIRQIESISLALKFAHTYLYGMYMFKSDGHNEIMERNILVLLNTVVKEPMYEFISQAFNFSYWSKDDMTKLSRITSLWLTYIKPWTVSSETLAPEKQTSESPESRPSMNRPFFNFLRSGSHLQYQNEFNLNDFVGAPITSQDIAFGKQKFIESQIEMYDNLRLDFLKMASNFNYNKNEYALPLLKKFVDAWKELNNFSEVVINFSKPVHTESVKYASQIMEQLEYMSTDWKSDNAHNTVLTDMQSMFPRDYAVPQKLTFNEDFLDEPVIHKLDSIHKEQGKKAKKVWTVDTRFLPVTSSENGVLVRLFAHISKKLNAYYGPYIHVRPLASLKYHFWLSMLSIMLILFLFFTNVS